MCKGSATTTTNQQYSANPAIQGAGTQALGMAQSAASTPFGLPVAPVAGFSQDQQNAFGTVAGQAGDLTQPFQQANNYINQSAQPISGADVANYYNPMAQNVTNQLQNIFGQQMSQTTGQLQQAAGGVGADRIAVGQGNLANQQGLAAGQTYAGLYNNALSAAQQGKQMQANAGYGLANNALAQQSGVLGQAQAQLGTGGLQQQLSQAQLNAPYQNQLAQLAYPFQTAQYLAGITGGLAPAFGGDTSQQQTAPPPSLFSQILGGGLAGAGILGGTGAFGSNGYLTGSNGLFGGGTPAPATGVGQYSARGGRIQKDSGGGVGSQGEGFDISGSLGTDPFNRFASYVPDIKLQPGSGQKPMLQSPQKQQDSTGNSIMNGLVGAGIKALPAIFAAADGGAVSPYQPMRGYDDGGDVLPAVNDLDPSASGFGARFGDLPPAKPPIAGDEVDRRSPAPGDLAFMQAGPAQELKMALAQQAAQNPDNPAHQAAIAKLAPGMNAMVPPPTAPAMNVPGMQVADAGGGSGASPYAPPSQHPTPVSTVPTDVDQSNLPYPGATKPSEGTDFAKSPWAALTAAGFGMMGGTSPFAGVNIGQGGLMGLKELEKQRTASREEEGVNQRARQLALQAETLRKKYTEMTPHEKIDAAYKGVIQTPLGVYDRVTGKFTSWEDMMRGQGQGAQGSPNAPTEASAQQKAPQLPLSPYDTNAHAQVPPANNEDLSRIMQAKQNPIYKGMIDSQRKGISDQINKDAIPARTVQGDLDKMEQNYESMLKEGVLQPGKGIDKVTDLYNTVDTISRYMGTGEWNENSTAAKEALNKLSNQLGFSLARTLGAREAMQIVQQAVSSVPNPTQNPQSFRRVLAEMNSKAQEQIDRQVAMDQWTTKHYGDISGFTQWFDQTHPHAAYTKMADEAAKAPRVYYFDDPAKMAKQRDDLRTQVGRTGGWIRMQGRDGQWQWQHVDGQ